MANDTALGYFVTDEANFLNSFIFQKVFIQRNFNVL